MITGSKLEQLLHYDPDGGIYLGLFAIREEAISYRDAVAVSLAGDFAFLNRQGPIT